MTISHNTRRIQSGDVSIFVRRFGNTRGLTPLLILHGLSYFSYDWITPASKLSEERQVAAMDMRGFGDSDWSEKRDYSVPTMAQDVSSVLDALAWKRVVLVGHSMGGRIATYAAAQNPERVVGLALIDFTPENARAGSKRVAETVAGVPERLASVEEALKYFNAPAEARERYENYLSRISDGSYVVKRDPYFQEEFRRILETGVRPKSPVDVWKLIGSLTCPILSMRGKRSDLYAREAIPKMKIANPRLEVVEVDAGHNIAGDNPDGFVNALRPFLQRIEVKNHE